MVAQPSDVWSRWLTPVPGHRLLCTWLPVTYTTMVSRQPPSNQTEPLELSPLDSTPAYRRLTANDCLLQDKFYGGNSHSRAAARSDIGISLSCFPFSFSYLSHSFPTFSQEYHPATHFHTHPCSRVFWEEIFFRCSGDPKNLLLIA